MSSFRKSKTLLTEAVGSYVNGVWVPGARSSTTVQASVQAFTKLEDLKPLPEGRHLTDYVKVYTDTRLQMTADGEGIQPDIIVHDGYGYELVSIFINQSDVINHYKYVAVKVFKFTNITDWNNNILKRP